DLVTGVDRLLDGSCDMTDALDIGDRGAAEFLDDARHGTEPLPSLEAGRRRERLARRGLPNVRAAIHTGIAESDASADRPARRKPCPPPVAAPHKRRPRPPWILRRWSVSRRWP